MNFLFGVGLGASFIFAADRNVLDEEDDKWYT
jgi:hypothetical protein